MRPHEVKVTFQPSGRSVYVLPGTTLLEATARAGIILQTPCGGQGTCGKCRVRVVSGADEARQRGSEALPAAQAEAGYRLACHTHVEGPLVVEVPEESRFETAQQILTGDAGSVVERLHPNVRKVHVELPLPTLEDARSDAARLKKALGSVQLPVSVIRELPAFLRRNNWKSTAVLLDGRVAVLEPGDTTRSLFGVAFDLGTTTVVGTLFDLTDGRECAVSARLNGQIPHGDDVISRILRIRKDPAALKLLQESVVATLNHILHDLVRRAGIRTSAIYEITLAGNSTMQQILCGYDPSALGEIPFVQVFDEAQTLPAPSVGLETNPCAELYVFPQIGGFVGGDTVSGMVAARLDEWKEPVLFVDIGTNGEIVLACNGKLVSTSTAAGPAFEGARITQGMRATTGAIEKVMIGDDVVVNVIGDARPTGLCGTALIDAVAELLRKGIVDETGRILPADEAPADLPAALRDRLVPEDGQTRFVLVWGDDSATGEPVCLWQKDVRELQLASGAIRAGIQVLMRQCGVAPSDLGAVLLAGAFGNFIRRNNARRIGLLPQIPCDRIRFIGNAASLGAKLALLSVQERIYAQSLAERTAHVDLSQDPEFQMEFGAAMMFPEADMEPCPHPEDGR